MQSLYIFGCSGFAVEVAQIVLSCKKYNVRCFIEKDSCLTKNLHRINNVEIEIISESRFLELISNSWERVSCVIAIANATICKRIYDKFKMYCDFPNIISPDAMINDSRIDGVGNIFFQQCFISWNVQIGSFNKFLPFVTIGHETVIGDFNEFNPKVSISGKTLIGDNNLFGMNSMLYQGKKVGNNNVIGMGSGIIRNISDDKTLYGNPAKQL